VAEAFAFVRSRPGLAQPDLQFHFAPAYFVDNGFEEYDGHAITMGPGLVAPRSRGWLRLRSADPTDKPRIQTNTLAEPEDVAALVAGARLCRQIAAAEPFASLLGHELFPGADIASDDDLAEDLRRRVELLYHPVGTCRMGSGEEAVVDPELRVRGVEGLRVVDASIMPTIVSGNTNAPTIAIAERAVDLIAGKPPLSGAPTNTQAATP
jgi:choline dehydrogenase-like flavoprotein